MPACGSSAELDASRGLTRDRRRLVRREHDCAARVHVIRDDTCDHGDAVGVEVGERLVENPESGTRQDHACEGQSPPLAGGERARRLLPRGGQPDPMVANTGTYLDAPFHRFADGHDIAGFPLAAVADLEGVVIRAAGRADRAIAAAVLQERSVRGRAVLIHTGWDAHWRTPAYGDGHPYLTGDAARWLVEGGAALVGIDSLNIDDAADGTRPAHTALLAAGIPIVEHLCGIAALPDEGFRFYAVPVRVRGLGSFPVRAFAMV